MATKTGIGLLPVVLILVAAVVFVDPVRELAGDLLGIEGGGTTLLGEEESQVMVAGDAESAARLCTTVEMIADRRCGDVRVVVFDAARIPFITRNVASAWAEGKPGVLTMNRSAQGPNRNAACGRFKKTVPDGSCDEYPMASTDEGGSNARTEEVPLRENRCQGGIVKPQYPENGAKFLVVISHPDLIPSKSYTGVDVAEDQTCGN
ncbi:hypothetical protein [Alloactinosynnema sp. L-07]|uniref:NucA/NucB deoxyribonuclease domain-containing protein n=1 Tax=Alloactinosynnema sp. L-07 TaxID=1653480 RepID=UPI00065EF73B|nr:NucA/NucB deoxyribonuclease domain-containing protein [Alloactinosynnema sp. L-07]CRK59149.1 hypothetical protein [Alloactinosynnema sp. L-07]